MISFTGLPWHLTRPCSTPACSRVFDEHVRGYSTRAYSTQAVEEDIRWGSKLSRAFSRSIWALKKNIEKIQREPLTRAFDRGYSTWEVYRHNQRIQWEYSMRAFEKSIRREYSKRIFDEHIQPSHSSNVFNEGIQWIPRAFHGGRFLNRQKRLIAFEQADKGDQNKQLLAVEWESVQ